MNESDKKNRQVRSSKQTDEYARDERAKKKLGVDFGIFSVVYFQLCHKFTTECEREREKLRKLSNEFPMVESGRALDFSGFLSLSFRDDCASNG